MLPQLLSISLARTTSCDLVFRSALRFSLSGRPSTCLHFILSKRVVVQAQQRAVASSLTRLLVPYVRMAVPLTRLVLGRRHIDRTVLAPILPVWRPPVMVDCFFTSYLHYLGPLSCESARNLGHALLERPTLAAQYDRARTSGVYSSIRCHKDC